MDLSTYNSSFVEKRAKPRMKCAYAALVKGSSFDGKNFEENGTVLNLSASGAYVLLNRIIKRGQDLSIKIVLPTGSLELGSSKIATKGTVVRTEGVSEGVLGVALNFQHYRFM